jgi:hypothetical protein
VLGGVGERLLEDAVRRLVETGRKRPPRPARADADGEAGGAVSLDERLEGGEPERRLHCSACVFSEIVLAQSSDELVDLTERLARHLLDRLERGLRALRVLLIEQPCRARLNEDDVDRVAGRVVEVARDAGAFLRSGEAALALGFTLGATKLLLEVGDPCAPLADSVADHPRPTPDEGAEEEGDGRELVLRDTGGTGVEDEEARHDPARQPPRRSRLLGAQGEEVEGDGRAERGTGWVAKAVQRGARRGG